VLGYGALNALLFVSYNRTEEALNRSLLRLPTHSAGANLWTTWIAGAVGGLATWVVSTPTELVKCRAQLASSTTASSSSWSIARQVVRVEGVKGLYFGGAVTALRDSVGYGFYFWSYELASRWLAGDGTNARDPDANFSQGAARVLLCGGLAGIVTWASIFPLDVIKTRVQAQILAVPSQPAVRGGEETPLVGRAEARTGSDGLRKRLGAWEIAKETYREGGMRPFFRGLAVCSVRAFIVNAVQWAVYEWIMLELGQGRTRRSAVDADMVAGI
jgi:solute carrier family 25 carnitine/acylcarnitine transporter 20/29